MKLNKPIQLLAISAASIAAAAFLSACATLTVDFVYVTCAKAAGPNNYGEVNVYEINSQSGRMRQIPTSPFFSGGRNPVAEAVAPDQGSLYVVNRDDNTIVQFQIGSDGKLYPQNTVNTPGIFPVAVSAAKGFLFVADTYAPLPTCSPASPCSGSVAVFPILTAAQAGALKPAQPANTLGPAVVNTSISASYWPLTLPGAAAADTFVPAAINVAASGSYLYVAGYDANTNAGYVFGFAPGSDGALSALPGFPVQVGAHPSGITSDSSGSYLYVTDSAQNAAYGFRISSGALTPLSGSPYVTGAQPAAIVLDASAKYAIVANTQDSNVTVYSVNSGSLSKLGTYTTGTQPVAIGIDPSLNQYVYTANFLGNTVSGFQLNLSDGSLLNSQFSPSASNPNPTAVAAITHNGNKK
ncbi:lactonase family protein [Occallatibacter savannae]|uniref:lactonase family protein n=1 Tax=Occallatibacter savannae TaxID=1002691 RepID=UPI0013A59C49|nr:beta-propeller fold lactonase family protein [Occallatibacter savannae]